MVTKRRFVPDRGDILWLDFNPIRGHEQGGRRPALVLSTRKYNALAKLAIVCPATSHIKRYPFEIPFKTKHISGVILADHIRNVDWAKRNAEKAGAVSEAVLYEIQEYIKKLVLE